MPGLISLTRLLVEIETDPIAGGETAQKRHEVGVRNGTYESSVSAGALYRALKDTPGLISGFYKLPFWNGDEDNKSYAKNPKHLNKHCHQFVYGAREGSEGKRAEDHAAATQSYYDDASIAPEKILDMLKKAGGFDGLKRGQSGEATRVKQKRTNPSGSKRSNVDDHAGIDASAGESTQLPEASPKGGGDPPKPGYPRLTTPQVFKHLLVTMEPHDLNRFLAEKSAVGDTFRIEVQRETDDANGMLVWRAITIRRILEST